MGDDCDSWILFTVIFQNSELLIVIWEYSYFQSLFKCNVASSLSPALFHNLQTACNCFLAPFFSLQSFQFRQNPFTIFFIVKSMGIPGLFIRYVIKVEGWEEFHGLFDFRPNVVGGFHDLSEGWFDDNGSFGLMTLEDDSTSGECSPHGGDNDKVEFDMLHFFFGLKGMFSSFLSDLNIKIFPIKLLLNVLLGIIEIILPILFFHLISNSIEL